MCIISRTWGQVNSGSDAKGQTKAERERESTNLFFGSNFIHIGIEMLLSVDPPEKSALTMILVSGLWPL